MKSFLQSIWRDDDYDYDDGMSDRYEPRDLHTSDMVFDNFGPSMQRYKYPKTRKQALREFGKKLKTKCFKNFGLSKEEPSYKSKGKGILWYKKPEKEMPRTMSEHEGMKSYLRDDFGWDGWESYLLYLQAELTEGLEP